MSLASAEKEAQTSATGLPPLLSQVAANKMAAQKRANVLGLFAASIFLDSAQLSSRKPAEPSRSTDT